jgi:RNA polymerase sigma-70 factor, ECF subfamily
VNASARQKAEESPDSDRIFRDELVAIIPSLRAFARGLCGNVTLADDLAQDAMTRAWSARASYMPGSNFRAWMYTIVRNQFYTTFRRNARMVSWDPAAAEQILVVDANQHDRLHVQDVVAALQKLPPEQREALILVGANGMSYEDAADVMGCAVGTIKSRIARGRVALAALIDGPDEDASIPVKRRTTGKRPDRPFATQSRVQ